MASGKADDNAPRLRAGWWRYDDSGWYLLTMLSGSPAGVTYILKKRQDCILSGVLVVGSLNTGRGFGCGHRGSGCPVGRLSARQGWGGFADGWGVVTPVRSAVGSRSWLDARWPGRADAVR